MGIGGNKWRTIMKIHTLDREYCNCKRHPRKFKKRLSIMNRKFIEAIDRDFPSLPMKMGAKGPFLVKNGKEYETHWIGPKHPLYKEIK
jgi:hypothetical protein